MLVPMLTQPLDECLERIRTRDGDVRAWVQVEPQPATGQGALDGVPFGAKDIIETTGLRTELGSPLYAGRISTEDAAIVRELRSRGALLIGKTATAAFAWKTPAATRNPRNLAHTPGGSSSGSAAAVASGMVPLALGTQTLGSVLRPASYCGVVGFKPTFGLLSLDGVLPCAPSLDTLGFFTSSVADMQSVWNGLGHATAGATSVSCVRPDPLPPVEPAMAAAFERAINAVRASGIVVRAVDFAALLADLAVAARMVMAYEAAAVHAERYAQHGDRLLDLADLVREGRRLTMDDYDVARRVISRGRMRINELYRDAPIVLVPAATGPAPLGLGSTGDPAMNAPWTAVGVPAISVPILVGGDELPLGLQLTAARGQDAALLAAAAEIERILQ
jgi:Asp-tRNA(Asn)/Glu-tRNA(Gln) amidotransferase A subunit family amidase